MDFRLMGLDGYDHHGSTFIKQERSDPFDKRVDDLGPFDHNKPPQQMLSFSTSTNQPDFVSFFSTKYGYGSGNMSGGMHGSFGGIRGTFTPAQWIELEHQAMVYKYITANVPVPSNLLIPIKKAIQSAAFPGFSIGSYPSPSYGWGAFHLGFSGNSDPEPGRCRRTDGKKWRCSRDAVPDQKYCERHINRGRHRSRKPVEGHTGQATPGSVTTKMVPPMSSMVSSGGDVPKGALITQHQIKASRPAGATNTSTRPVSQSHNDQQGLSMMPQTVNLESNDSQYSIQKQHISFDESSVSDFGIVSNDALLNPSQKSSYMDCKSYDTLLEFNSRQNQEQYHHQQFTEDWPKDQAGHRVAIPWLKDPKSDWTQLSMSIPLSNEFSSSSCSPIQDLGQARQMGLGVGTIVTNVGSGTKQNEWIPVTSRNSMGGPLGEVLLNNGSPPHSTV